MTPFDLVVWTDNHTWWALILCYVKGKKSGTLIGLGRNLIFFLYLLSKCPSYMLRLRWITRSKYPTRQRMIYMALDCDQSFNRVDPPVANDHLHNLLLCERQTWRCFYFSATFFLLTWHVARGFRWLLIGCSCSQVLYEPLPVIYVFAINSTAGKDRRMYEVSQQIFI